MAVADLSTSTSIDTSKDSVVIVNCFETMPGGRTLDVTGFADTEISAGHIIIKETATGEYKPLPTTGTIPASHTYAGVLRSSILTSSPQAAIMVRGTVNEAYCKYSVPAGAKTAFTLTIFINE